MGHAHNAPQRQIIRLPVRRALPCKTERRFVARSVDLDHCFSRFTGKAGYGPGANTSMRRLPFGVAALQRRVRTCTLHRRIVFRTSITCIPARITIPATRRRYIYRLQRHRTAKAHESFLAPSNARQTLQAVQRAVNSVTARGLCSRYGKPRKGSQMGYLYQEDRAPAAPKPQSCLADVVLTIVAMFAIMFLLR